MWKTIAIVALLVLSLLLAPSSASAAAGVAVTDKTGDGEWTGDTWQVDMFPGEEKSTTLTLYNSSTSSLAVEVSIIPGSLDSGNLTFELDRSTSFPMLGKSTANVVLTAKASGSVTPGIYTAELGIRSEIPPTPPPVVSGEGNGGGDSEDGGVFVPAPLPPAPPTPEPVLPVPPTAPEPTTPEPTVAPVVPIVPTQPETTPELLPVPEPTPTPTPEPIMPVQESFNWTILVGGILVLIVVVFLVVRERRRE